MLDLCKQHIGFSSNKIQNKLKQQIKIESSKCNLETLSGLPGTELQIKLQFAYHHHVQLALIKRFRFVILKPQSKMTNHLAQKKLIK